MSTAFIQNINSVSTGEAANSYRFELNVIIIDTMGVNNGYTIAYEAPWGADWKLLAKEAVFAYTAAGNALAIEPVTRIVFSDFSYT